jgi:hypothetical protein
VQAVSSQLAVRQLGRFVYATVAAASRVRGRRDRFDPTADLGHKAMRFVFTLNGHVPREV